MLNNLRNEFKNVFGSGGTIFFAPSRINIIGEHIDYNGGKVMPAAIEIGTYGIAKPNELGLLRLKSLNINGEGEISLDDLEYDESRDWMNYVVGMVKFIREAGHKVSGLDIIVWGNIPNGSGLSSSASLEMLIGEMVNHLFNSDEISKVELIKLGVKTENEYINVNSGVMDQFAIRMGKEGNAILLDTHTLEYNYIPMELGDYTFVIMNTNKRRELKDSKYNERRAECETGLEILQKYIEIENLCDIRVDDNTEELLSKIEDEIIRNRVRHVVFENDRVYEMVKAMKENDIGRIGDILNRSHNSLKDLYEVSGFELDSIVSSALKSNYTVGARMTGAGFGGCAIALVESDYIEEFIESTSKLYEDLTGISGEFFTSKIDDGPRVLGEA
ncbi:MAG: galactokinase [Tissierellia bacterium]|nr:galactokinase [Tissierellia bacterium]